MSGTDQAKFASSPTGDHPASGRDRSDISAGDREISARGRQILRGEELIDAYHEFILRVGNLVLDDNGKMSDRSVANSHRAFLLSNHLLNQRRPSRQAMIDARSQLYENENRAKPSGEVLVESIKMKMMTHEVSSSKD